jgi:hypothetical protein
MVFPGIDVLNIVERLSEVTNCHLDALKLDAVFDAFRSQILKSWRCLSPTAFEGPRNTGNVDPSVVFVAVLRLCRSASRWTRLPQIGNHRE